MEVIGAIVEATMATSTCSSGSAWRPTAGCPSGSTRSWAARDRRLESDNAFVYRFDDDRIAEMWMFIGAPPGSEAFFE